MDNRLQVVIAIATVFAAASISLSSSAFADQTGKGPEMMDTPPDPERAVLAEYEQLKARGTAEAFALFIERHPDHPLADDARQNLKKLRGD